MLTDYRKIGPFVNPQVMLGFDKTISHTIAMGESDVLLQS